MPSSKNSPGSHDRKPENDPVMCHAQTRKGVRCSRVAVKGTGGLCKGHADRVMPQPTEQDAIKGAVAKHSNRQSAGALLITEQAREALRRLGQPVTSDAIDPKQVLLEAVRSIHTQRMIWEGLLAATPDEDFGMIGTPAIPGSKSSSRGVRIEVIQRNLEAVTKSAARISKMAIDAGIEERMVRLAEAQEALIADTVRAGLIAAISSMRLAPQAEALAIEAALASAATHLRQLAAANNDTTIIDGVSRAVREIPV